VATHLFHWLRTKFSTLAVFRVPNFWDRFEALNDVFWGFWAQTNVFKNFLGKNIIVLLSYTFPTMYRAPQTEIVCKSYAPEKLMYQLPPSGHANILDFHLPGLGFWIFLMLSAYEWTLLGELGFYLSSILELVRKICNLLVLLACFIVVIG
jgi:hypothetical protein